MQQVTMNSSFPPRQRRSSDGSNGQMQMQVPSSAPTSPNLRDPSRMQGGSHPSSTNSGMMVGLVEAPLAPQPLAEREAAQWHSGTR